MDHEGQDMDVETRIALAAQVRGERKARKLTQAELADAADVSEGMVSNLERRKSIPQPANLRAILRVLDIDMPDVGEVPAGEEGTLPICDKCGRIKWPGDYELLFDVLGAYFDTLTDRQRLQAMGDLTRDVIARRIGGR